MTLCIDWHERALFDRCGRRDPGHAQTPPPGLLQRPRDLRRIRPDDRRPQLLHAVSGGDAGCIRGAGEGGEGVTDTEIKQILDAVRKYATMCAHYGIDSLQADEASESLRDLYYRCNSGDDT